MHLNFAECRHQFHRNSVRKQHAFWRQTQILIFPERASLVAKSINKIMLLLLPMQSKTLLPVLNINSFALT